ncbi:helix-turn-helix transcriptional regulator [Streptomyces sp. AV19]|uniref:helix-turn-helix transcriptional regulator n=1 Tax=Streptomyces sp. AV19 TaxID=2793068 RepID=UPI0018FEFC47|nr:helix-turn-helix transcriptional regulator [Streptomyces sp. AV19]MBH1935440.1 helix-turn-helix transcriptional regulator [Streptomyces sp. AV19]MDG4531326.1 helix-turn-helix transcriptional regulator [Streptomyces sp. AV19]
MRPLIESVVNNTHIRALEESVLADIGDIDAAVAALNSLVGRAKCSVNVVLPTSLDGLRAVGSALRRLADGRPRETRVQILSTPELALGGHLADLGSLGSAACDTEIRLASGVRHGAVVIDQQVALVRPGARTGDVEASLIRAPGVVRALHDMMMTAWSRAVPLVRYQQLRERLRRDSGTEIMRLLGEGYTDEAAARELDISVRTYRRRVADIMRLLGARSRFQAGVNAAGLGLFPA